MPFFGSGLPPPALPLIPFPRILHDCGHTINLNSSLFQVYVSQIVPSVFCPGEDGQLGSTATADIALLQAISKRVHYGKFVAGTYHQIAPFRLGAHHNLYLRRRIKVSRG